MNPPMPLPEMALVTRKRVELRTELASLTSDLNRWRELVTKPSFEKHYQQVRRITAHIGAVETVVDDDLAGATVGNALLAVTREVSEKILTAFAIWDFFRSKLSMRLDDSLRSALEASDELAWACYESALKCLEKKRGEARAPNPSGGPPLPTRTAPLVYVNCGFSPFTRTRDTSFQVGPTAGNWILTQPFEQIVEKLPTPLIGIPWYGAANVPGMPVIAHEVGHVLAGDAGLKGRIEELVRGAIDAQEHAANWVTWANEIFADLYGCLCLGPSFVSSLVDLLIEDPQEIATQRSGGAHPPSSLRVRINAEVLRKLECGGQAAQILKRWTECFPTHALPDYEKDVEPVVTAVWKGPYDALGIGAICEAIDYRQIRTGAEEVRDHLRAKQVSSIEATDPRALVAGARALYDEDPGSGGSSSFSLQVQEIICTKRPAGFRFAPGIAYRREDPKAEAVAWAEKEDRQRGTEFFRSISC